MSFFSKKQVPAEVVSETPAQNTPVKQESLVREILRFSFYALIIVLPIRMFIAQPFIVSGESMESTFST